MIDIGDKEFSLGLTYVGLSRVKSLEGMMLMEFTWPRLETISKRSDLADRREFEYHLNRSV